MLIPFLLLANIMANFPPLWYVQLCNEYYVKMIHLNYVCESPVTVLQIFKAQIML